jgi:hypothetical protein
MSKLKGAYSEDALVQRVARTEIEIETLRQQRDALLAALQDALPLLIYYFKDDEDHQAILKAQDAIRLGEGK